jgi:hypothetical protein
MVTAEERNKAMHAFLDMPKLSMRRVPRGLSQKKRSELNGQQLNGIVFETPANVAPPQQPTSKEKEAVKAATAATAMAPRSLGRAARLLIPAKQFVITAAEVFGLLVNMHPDGEAPEPLGDVLIPTRIDPSVVGEMIKSMSKGASPGPDGWTADLLDVVARDPNC